MTRRVRPRRTAGLLAVTTLAALAALTVLATTSGAAGGPKGLTAKRVHATAKLDGLLVRQLKKSKSGKVAAVVTTWNRGDLKKVERLGVRGKKLSVLPMMLARSLTAKQLAKLKQAPFVRSVWANRKYQTRMEDTTWLTRARYAWEGRDVSTANGSLGGIPAITGQGVELAEIDTGIDGKHEDADNLIEFCDSVAAATSTAESSLCAPWGTNGLGAGYPAQCAPAVPLTSARDFSQDDEGHGTHVFGTIAGTGEASGGRTANRSTIGMAPDAKMRVYSSNVGISLVLFEILASYDDMTCKKIAGYSKVVAVNNSWGGGAGGNYPPEDPISVAIKRAYDAGILSVFAAGNDGPEHNTLSDTCVSPWAVCVAASTKLDGIVAFSSRGRPSQPEDTNRNGIVGQPGATPCPTCDPDQPDPSRSYDPGDIAPDNHDRRIAQAHDVGIYRPTITAPGVNINSMSANKPTCFDEQYNPATVHAECYEELSGTSMATPHVDGLIGLITQAYRHSHFGQTPSPAIITEILERSSNLQKLPAYEAEEQGTGRIDAINAIKVARAYGGFNNPYKRPNIGYPTPPFEANRYPASPGSIQTLTGCTLPASWPAVAAPPLEPFVDRPPVGPGVGWGQHFIFVPERTERLRVTLRWAGVSNLYIRLWRPGVDPSAPNVDADAENAALAEVINERWVEVRSPEESNAAEGTGPPPAIPSGYWIARVYHRVGDVDPACSPASQENPKNVGPGKNYSLTVEVPGVTTTPTVSIQTPAPGTNLGAGAGRFVEFTGTAAYPNPWEGVTNWEVPGTSGQASGGGGPVAEPSPDTRTVLYMHGTPLHDTSEPEEIFCTGDGRADIFACGGPFLLPDTDLNDGPPGSWKAITPAVSGTADRNIYDPNWVWCLATDAPNGCFGTVAARPGPTTVEGPMTVEWWAETVPACTSVGAFSMGWTIRLWADDRLAFESGRIEATPTVCGVPSRLKTVVNLPRIRAAKSFVLHVDPNELDVDQELNAIFYDSDTPNTPCLGTAAGGVAGRCDSLVKMPVIPEGSAENRPPGVPAHVRVTDTHSGLRVAWDRVPNASQYLIFKSTNPSFTVTPTSTPTFTTAGTACTSPNPGAPYPQGWPADRNGSRAGLCYTDTAVTTLTTYYYRVVAIVNGQRGNASLLAYGTPTLYDRVVRLKVDRIYQPQTWEFATLLREDGTSWRYLWDRLGLDLTIPHAVAARSFTQGIGSTKFRFGQTPTAPPPPPQDPAVTLVKTGPATATRGSTITYTITYKNLGPKPSSNARVVDTLPSSVSYVSSSPSGSYNPFTRKVTWNLGTVPVGAEGSLTLRVRVSSSASGTIVNRADFTADLTVATPATWATLVQ